MTAEEYLQKYHIQRSVPRILVVDDLMRYRTHATADEIYARLIGEEASMGDARAGISRASVFNVLNTLVEKRAVRAIQIEGDVTRYDIDLKLHGHFRCTHCGRIFDFPLMRRPSVTLPEGCYVAQEDYFVFGLCSECKANLPKKRRKKS